MAVTSRKSLNHMRPVNKEFDWDSIRDNVLEEYLGDDPFGFGETQRERSSSDDSCQLFDFSGSSEQSNQTEATSPIPPWDPEESTAPAACQPKAKAPSDFWHKKLRALEQNAAECERRQKLRAAKSHPDFLSLGGFPSPPAIPASPTGQSYSAQRSKSRTTGNAANGNKTPTQQRSVSNLRAVSRGRPVGVMKPAATAAINPNATIRQRNGSPSKMMNPSRYRAGFKDVWAERILQSPKKFELRVDNNINTFPESPPLSARSAQHSFAAFGSPTFSAIEGSDEQISPLASTFNQATRIHTPLASPLLSPGSHTAPSYFDVAPPLPGNPYTTQTVPLNDTAPLYPDRTWPLAANKIQEFDFGFDSSPKLDDPWSTTSAPHVDPFASTFQATASAVDPQDPFIGLENTLEHSLRINAHAQNQNLGLGISCDSNGNYTTVPGNVLHISSMPPSSTPYYVPSLPNGLPSTNFRPPNGLHAASKPANLDFPLTPQRQRGRNSHDRSPSPTRPGTESRSRQTSASRRRSQHRRTKSASTTPRHHGGDKGGGFVNFTPGDAGKILSGVAPSGSSKTKARREKEAADKRRKLSQAAMQAVIEAGGDVESLQRAGVIS
ncbi:hypothetical protein CB0940_07740 [Cercospora beticola]|uniref:Developmental regulatory protein wetA n=1 Tax=Cercospora beticola TaxID=122368 RepID=A0A2G5HAI7_CERBT|nr:hypothetical protein CB0940_07740 [Cercospora beticola]PIA89303.1 hypothetical protein CB0940_07740 [Cercospora beticola]WPB03709.1 hypothetical protein RHO25_008353 [Cercospora beticola]CAK1357530.1 unnamed protein product [Cercospora beticola]